MVRHGVHVPLIDEQTRHILLHHFRNPRVPRGYHGKATGARFERVLQNGILIHENVECTGPTRGAWSSEDTPRGPLRLQGDHGPVAYRNIRIRPLE